MVFGKRYGFWENDFWEFTSRRIIAGKSGMCYELGARYPAISSRQNVECVVTCVEVGDDMCDLWWTCEITIWCVIWYGREMYMEIIWKEQIMKW